jgi:hypothetical protein
MDGGRMNARQDPVVIGAVGGSGTRVFTKILRHAGLFMGKHVDDQGDSQPVSAFYSEFASEYLARNGELEEERSDRLSGRLEACLQEHLDGIPEPDHPWGVKNSRSILMLPFWHDCFPGMRFLHVLRDGRDMAYSAQQNQVRRHGKALLGPDMSRPAPERAMLWWAQVNGAAADYGEATLGERYLRIRLEDLCGRPKRTVKALFAFVGSTGQTKEAVAEVRRPQSLGRWRERPQEEVAQLEALGRNALERFGYLARSHVESSSGLLPR